jgi:hypothetical protein
MHEVARAGYSKTTVDRAGVLWRDASSRPTGGQLDQREVQALLDAAEAIDWWRQRHVAPLARVNASVRHYLHEVESGPHGVTQRLKRFATIAGKLARFPAMALTQMEDVGGVRVVLSDQRAVDQVVGRLEANWDITRHRDYARHPKGDGYRAIHLIVRRSDCKIELQLRTSVQDLWAQSVEDDTRAVRLDLKFGGGPHELLDYYRTVSEVLARREAGILPDDPLIEHLRETYSRSRHLPEP